MQIFHMALRPLSSLSAASDAAESADNDDINGRAVGNIVDGENWNGVVDGGAVHDNDDENGGGVGAVVVGENTNGVEDGGGGDSGGGGGGFGVVGCGLPPREVASALSEDGEVGAGSGAVAGAAARSDRAKGGGVE
jgi:hypothetical protein